MATSALLAAFEGNDLLKQHIVTKLAAVIMDEEPGADAASVGSFAAFRLVCKDCRDAAKLTLCLRLRSLTPFVDDKSASKVAVVNMLRNFRGVTHLYLRLQGYSPTYLADTSDTFSGIAALLPMLTDLHLRDNSRPTHRSPGIHGKDLSSFAALRHFSASNLTIVGQLVVPSSLLTLFLFHIFQPVQEQILQSLDLRFAAELGWLQVAVWDGLNDISFPENGKPLTVALRSCDGLLELKRHSDTASVVTLHVSDCAQLTDISSLLGKELRDIQLESVPRLRIAPFQSCINLEMFDVCDLPRLEGGLDFRGKKKLMYLTVKRCGMIDQILVSCCFGLTCLEVWGCDELRSLDLSNLLVQEVLLVDNVNLSVVDFTVPSALLQLEVKRCGLEGCMNLTGMARLKRVHLEDCVRVEDILFDQKCANLNELHLDCCTGMGPIVDIRSVPNIQKITVLHCPGIKSVKCGASSTGIDVFFG